MSVRSGPRLHVSCGFSNKPVKMGQWKVKPCWLLPPGALGNISTGKKTELISPSLTLCLSGEQHGHTLTHRIRVCRVNL